MPAGVPRVAATYASYRKPNAAQRTVALDRLKRVGGATGIITATGTKPGA